MSLEINNVATEYKLDLDKWDRNFCIDDKVTVYENICLDDVCGKFKRYSSGYYRTGIEIKSTPKYYGLLEIFGYYSEPVNKCAECGETLCLCKNINLVMISHDDRDLPVNRLFIEITSRDAGLIKHLINIDLSRSVG